MNNNLEWSDWRKFPDPRKGEYLLVPFGSGVYQLKNTKQMNLSFSVLVETLLIE